MDNALLMIFARNAEEGQVKTRLAQTVGAGKALQIYKRLLHYTLEVAREVDVDRQIWYDSYVPEQSPYAPYEFEAHVQHGETLGERMSAAFRQAFKEKYKRVVIIGTDCALLTAGHLEQAFQNLKDSPVTIGPARDGGYYLLGMRSHYPRLFKDKNWGTETVYRETIRDLKDLGVKWTDLPELNDVDRWSDWQEVKAKWKDNFK